MHAADNRQAEIFILNLIIQMDTGKTRHFDLGVNQGMIQFLTKRNQIGFLKGINVLAHIGRETFGHIGGLFRVFQAQGLDRRKGIIEKMRLNLGDHNLDALLGDERLFVFPLKLQVEPGIEKHAAKHRGDFRERDRAGGMTACVQQRPQRGNDDIGDRDQLIESFFLYKLCQRDDQQ